MSGAKKGTVQEAMQDKRPNFFMVGAPKTGTSSFFKYLSGHPEIFLPAVKELHYFSYPEVSDTYYDIPFVTSESEYLDLFDNRRNEKAAGDLSPSYLFRTEAAERIRRFQPEARIIISLRNPVERAISHYLMDVRLGYQKRPLAEFMQRTEENRLFYEQYIEVGMYSRQIQAYLEKFGPENVLILLYDDLVRDRHAYLREIFRHLGVDQHVAIDMRVHNAFSMPRSGFIRRLIQTGAAKRISSRLPDSLKRGIKSVTHSRERPDLSPDEPQLAEIFREDIHAVARIIGRDLSHWLPEFRPSANICS